PAPAPAAPRLSPEAALLESARARRLRIARAEQQPGLDAAAVAAEAKACAADARGSWTASLSGAADAGPLPDAGASADPAQVGAAGAEALYLDAVCSATWARMQGFTPLIERRDELLAELSRVAELAPDLDGAGAERELGALYAALPAFAGGDLEKARLHLEAALRRAPQDPRNRIVLARTVAVKSQDRALFEEQLRAAEQSDDPALAAEAQALLARESDLFGPAEAAQPVPGGPQPP
ncbi:MAG TPA: TRAP transporter TatT component family protein, partial [Myxococcales bacterium]|nr:TRAP transporter TatT component family protein [Myxococcales bacterium]